MALIAAELLKTVVGSVRNPVRIQSSACLATCSVEVLRFNRLGLRVDGMGI